MIDATLDMTLSIGYATVSVCNICTIKLTLCVGNATISVCNMMDFYTGIVSIMPLSVLEI